MFELLKASKDNNFYCVKKAAINEAEENMGILIPKQLKEFYQEIGYGFLASKIHNINRIMGPSSVERFRIQTEQFKRKTDESAIFNEYSNDKLVFFEVNESLYLSIGFTKNNNGQVFYYDKKIADTLSEFFEKYMENERYFL